VGPGLKVLGTIPDPARRIELLMGTEAQAETGSSEDRRAVKLGFQGELTLRTKLREWNATEAQVETIIQQFKK